MKEFQRNLNTIVIHNSNTDLGSNSNGNLLIFKVIVFAPRRSKVSETVI